MARIERVYSVLVVSAAENFNTALTSLLPRSLYDPVHVVSNVSSAKRAVLERSYDFVIVNAPPTDDGSTRFAIDTAASPCTVVLLFVRNEVYAAVYDKVVDYGVFTLPRPTSKAVMLQALSWLISARERMRRFEKKTLSIEDKMNEIRLVNRAKWLLISELKMTESDAHRYIEKQAMDRCVPKKSVAEEIIRMYS